MSYDGCGTKKMAQWEWNGADVGEEPRRRKRPSVLIVLSIFHSACQAKNHSTSLASSLLVAMLGGYAIGRKQKKGKVHYQNIGMCRFILANG